MFDAFLRSWPFDPWLAAALTVTACVYLRGWWVLHCRDAQRWTWSQPAGLLGGLAAIYLALASPIEPFSALLLQVHMVQHLLLMMVAPPLLWLGKPFFPMLRGLPVPVRTYWIGPVLRSRRIRALFSWLTHPLVALPLYTITTWLWHLPTVYDLAVRQPVWHYSQHFCFLAAALLFWYPVVRPYPSRPSWSTWLLVPYLLLADVQNTVLAALLTFSHQVLYAYYDEVPRLAGLSALDDQAAAGVLMWVPGSVAFLLPLFWIGLRLLYGQPRVLVVRSIKARVAPPVQHFDLLNLPLLGRFLKWRHARVVLQLPLLLVACVLVIDGLRGPQAAGMNLAGVVPWIHWRGLVILGLLVLGNVFCMACPFTLPRTLARRWLPAGWNWPRWLRSKWLAVALMVVYLWAYEALALWDSPWWTAWIVIGYFLAAFVVDGLFRGAAFCKYVCPIGQFNFVQSLMSPFEVRVSEPAICATCQTKDCIRGHETIPGCELHLYQPRKSGNMDCTFCLDCVHACPHDNVGLIAGLPGRQLWHDRFRSGIGRFGKRPDLAVLVLVLVFGAFVNAAGMIGPVVGWQDQLQVAWGINSRLAITTVFYVVALILLPAMLVIGATIVSRRWGRLPVTNLAVATRFVYALVPLGFGMWLAHYSFHFLTSFASIVPTTQRFVGELGWTAWGPPRWACSCCVPVADGILHAEIIMLDLGLLLSLYAGYRIALIHTSQLRQALKSLLPWCLLMVLLFAVGIWILISPMEMRGMMDQQVGTPIARQ